MPCRDAARSVEWISTDAELAEAASKWSNVIGIDTEFQRTDTFFPLPGLYQIASSEVVYLLDPLAIDNWQPLLERLHDPEVELVMHACGEDLELFNAHLNAAPTGIFDTQLANAFLSPDFSLSYTNLVERHLGVTLGKPQTRSNWLRRPLSEEQVRYACEDVLYLGELESRLESRLQAAGRLSWFEEAMAGQGVFSQVAPADYYRNFTAAWRLDGQALAILQELVLWRELKARSEDVPRSRVVRDEHLLAFAQMPELAERRIEEVLPNSVARRYGQELLLAHQRGRSAQPVARLDAPLNRAQGEASRSAREIARQRAEAAGFAPELLARKRDVEACLRHFCATGELSDHYLGWRESLVGDDFRRILGKLT
ncbi:MAG: HRDC domain-containing protein [Pseudomonadales bacterium]|nr:HRDC domain-containing protein [Pseudomonadales bacterium]